MAIDDRQRRRGGRKKRKGGKNRKVQRPTTVRSAFISPYPEDALEEWILNGRRRSHRESPSTSLSVHVPTGRDITSPPLYQATTGNGSSYNTNIESYPPTSPPWYPRPHRPNLPAEAASITSAGRQPRPPPARWDEKEDVPIFRDIAEYKRYKERKERAKLRPPRPLEIPDIKLPSLTPKAGSLINIKQNPGQNHGKRKKKKTASRRVVYSSSEDDGEYDGDKVPTAKDILATIRRKDREKKIEEEREEEREAAYGELYNLRSNPSWSAARRRRDDDKDNRYDYGFSGGRSGLPHRRV